MAEVLLNQEQIKEIIPHRDPFLLIDEVLSMEVGKKVVARKYIKEDDFWFKGHFRKAGNTGRSDGGNAGTGGCSLHPLTAGI